MMKKHKHMSIFVLSLTLALLLGNISIIQTVNAINYQNTLGGTDTIKWYRVNLASGQQINLGLNVPTSMDFDLYLTTTVILSQNMAGRWIPDAPLDRSINMGDTSEAISYTTTFSGLYYIAVHSHSGVGQYTLTSDQALELFDPILEIVVIVFIVIGIVSAIAVAGFLVYRRRRSKSDSEFFDDFYDKDKDQELAKI